MTDKKLTDNEIVKALECCSEKICKQCPNFSEDIECSEKLIKLALDLINRLQAENEKFKDRQKPTGASGYKIENGKVVFFTNILGGYKEEKENLEEVVKTLNELLQECYNKDEIAFALKCKTEELKTAKAEAYKEFVNKIKVHAYYINFPKEHRVVDEDDIDNLLKEMVGEDDAKTKKS